MVCVPCFIIPVLLYIWHKFLQPLILRYWNPWEKKDAEGNVIKAGPEFPFECKGGVCPFVPGGSKKKAEEDAAVNSAEGNDDAATKPTTNSSAEPEQKGEIRHRKLDKPSADEADHGADTPTLSTKSAVSATS